MQKNVLQLCRMTRNVCPQQDSVRAVFFANESGSVKVKIAVLCISVFQPVRKILLAELLKDFLLVFRLKAAQYKVVLTELCPQAFVKDGSGIEKGFFIVVVVHLIIILHPHSPLRSDIFQEVRVRYIRQVELPAHAVQLVELDQHQVDVCPHCSR